MISATSDAHRWQALNIIPQLLVTSVSARVHAAPTPCSVRHEEVQSRESSVLTQSVDSVRIAWPFMTNSRRLSARQKMPAAQIHALLVSHGPILSAEACPKPTTATCSCTGSVSASYLRYIEAWLLGKRFFRGFAYGVIWNLAI